MGTRLSINRLCRRYHLRGKFFLFTIVISLFIHEAVRANENILMDPKTILSTAKRMDFVGKNNFSIEKTNNGDFLLSVPQHSASGLYQKVEISGQTLTRVRWMWRVNKLHRSADLRQLAHEDSAATIFFIFGEPSFFNRDVPTLAYVWSSTPVKEGTILPSLRYASLRYIQMRGASSAGNWETEERNIAADYEAVFGSKPKMLRYIALFNDNDQTLEPVSAFFGKIVDSR